uniref:PLAT domain-containing protein n=1 Tax=Mastacembelus armatus TaxID=205130 RepID=A0A3Q3SFN4_9TELE
MVNYHVTVFTADLLNATTLNNVHIKLVGTDSESEHTWLMGLRGASSFIRGASSFTVSCSTSLGNLVLIELNKQCFRLFPEDSWFPAKVDVKSPEGDTYTFPIYRWITGSEVHRGTKAASKGLSVRAQSCIHICHLCYAYIPLCT